MVYISKAESFARKGFLWSAVVRIFSMNPMRIFLCYVKCGNGKDGFVLGQMYVLLCMQRAVLVDLSILVSGDGDGDGKII